MAHIRQVGIDPTWSKKNQQVIYKMLTEMDPVCVNSTLELEEYIAAGEVRASIDARSRYKIDPATPVAENWESSYVSSNLRSLANREVLRFELSGLEGLTDAYAAMRSYYYAHTADLIELYRHAMFPVRFGRSRQALSAANVSFVALGIVVGCEDSAVRLARCQISAWRKTEFNGQTKFPIAHFMLRILADHLNEQPLSDVEQTSDSVAFDELFRVWRNDDLETLTPAIITACDIHTRRCKVAKPPHMHEFDNGMWTRTPIEILLLYKLRQLNGLENPVVNHPLMNTALGTLPLSARFEPDDLFTRVLARMHKDGYSEQRVYEACRSAFNNA
jgi:hypothetical protein